MAFHILRISILKLFHLLQIKFLIKTFVYFKYSIYICNNIKKSVLETKIRGSVNRIILAMCFKTIKNEQFSSSL